jgi:hypothetical protein
MAGNSKEMRLCNIPECSLFPSRMGKNPARARKERGGQKDALLARDFTVERPYS